MTSWDGDAGDGYWTNALNWSGNAQPAAGESIFVTNGATVIMPNGNLPNACTVVVNGASTLTASNFATRLFNSTILVATGTLTGSWWDLNNGTLRFESGAAVTMGTLEHKGRNTFQFKLSPAGFSTLTPGQIRFASTVWSNMTYHIDASAFSATNGAIVVLMDYASAGDTAYTNAFTPTINIVSNIGSPAASLSFDNSTLQLAVRFGVYVPLPKTWDGGGGDTSWTTPANWNPDGTPLASDDLLVGSGATVTNGQDSFRSLNIDTGATVRMSSEWMTHTTTVAGTLNRAGIIRLSNTSLSLGSSGTLGVNLPWLAAYNRSTINFSSGAAFANSGMAMSFQGPTTLGFTLSEAGFTTLNAGILWNDAGTTWTALTFNINLSNYNYSNGLSKVLLDFSTHQSDYNLPFAPKVNLTATNGLGGVLSFDTVNSRLMLTIDPPGNDAPVVNSRTVSVYSGTPTNATLTGTDMEGSNLTFAVVTYPTNGMLTGTATNLIYTPTNAPFLFDSFSYTANDGEKTSNTGTVKLAFIPYTDNELWALYHSFILSDPLNTEWLTNWVDSGISIWQVRYAMGPMTGSRRTAYPRIAAFYAYPVGGTNLPGIVEIHGGGQVASADLAKYWAQQGYAAISINWGARPLLAGQPNTDWDGVPEGFGPDFGRVGVTNALFQEWHMPAVYSDGSTLYDVNHPLNSSWLLNAYAARRALTFLTAQPIVNTGKLGVLGWSMGGQSTTLTATDPRLTAVSPGVGGMGYFYEDWWGLPGTARSTNGVNDFDLYERTVDCQSYWPDITCAMHFLEAANDFNAPFDLVTKAMALQPTNAPQVLAFTPHMNHAADDASYASRVMWMKDHLAGSFDFPKRAEAEIVFGYADGVPRLRIWPDLSTTNPLVRVDAFYSVMRNSLTRFWRNATTVYTNGYWEAECPVYDLDEMFVALGVVYYDTGSAIPLPAGYSSTSKYISVASEVITIYPPGLATNGVQETEVKERQIDNFARGWKDWWWVNANNPQWWEIWSRKLGDPSWIGPTGSALAVDVTTTAPGNAIGIKLVTRDWNTTAANTFTTLVPLPAAGTTSISIPVSAFTNGSGVVLTTWTNVNQLGFMAGWRINTNLAYWSGAMPVLSNLRWSGGAYRPGEEFASWMSGFGIRGTNTHYNADTEGDGMAALFEYAVGGSPSTAVDGYLLPNIGNNTGESFQALEYVYQRRRDASVRGLSYTVEGASGLQGSPWSTNGVTETGAGIVDSNYESVTNRIPGGVQVYGRLRIVIAE